METFNKLDLFVLLQKHAIIGSFWSCKAGATSLPRAVRLRAS